jgi:hypothetical protein
MFWSRSACTLDGVTRAWLEQRWDWLRRDSRPRQGLILSAPRSLLASPGPDSMRHLLSALALSALLLPAARAGTLFVDAALGTGANDGSSWANAYQGPDGLQAARSSSPTAATARPAPARAASPSR